MKRWLTTLLQALGLYSFLAATPLQADENPPEVLKKAGVLLAEILDLGSEYREALYKSDMTAESSEKLEALARKIARKMAGYRDDLAELSPGLNPNSAYAAELGEFLARWPDEAAFRNSLLHEGNGIVVERTVQSLWLQVPDHRRKSKWRWKTPFPLFRP